MNRVKIIAASLLAVLLLAFSDNFTSAAVQEAMIRVVHASPDAPEVDIYVDNQSIVVGASFKDVTDYLKVPAGSHKVEVYAIGTKGKEKPVISTNVTVEANKAYTLAAINQVAHLELKVAQDDMNVAKGKSKIRIAHFSPDAPAVNVGINHGPTLFKDTTFKQMTNYSEVDAGTYDLTIATSQDNKKILEIPNLNLEANTVYTVLAINKADSLETLLLKDNTAMPSEMPKTGMGGASEDNYNSIVPVLTLLGIGAVAIFVVRRHRGYESE
ncbi:DUF4397 domain-containing protein [Priestia aryabhattai]|uniref:DUF4397 domain-containing protein n=1 Tax=Priestia aryabhattai TaxID=412384 RepID=UPI00211BD6C1|nr:DUF4397 domain-containing protein [Priestia aryabhattai]MCQ9280577.1 DUF4397 domain-containing protein [Priestia aryabhattai]